MSSTNDSMNEINLIERKRQANVAFDLWSLKKSRYDKGILLLGSVTEDRIEDEPEETYDKIVVSMVCIDCVLGKLGRVSRDEKTMKKVFYAWCLNKFTYRDCVLTEKEIESFTEGYRTAFLKKNEEGDPLNPMNPELPEGATYLPTVKYIKAKKASAGDNAKIALRKALTPDQQISNTVFSNEFRRRWRRAIKKVYLLARKEFEGGDEEDETEKDEAKEAEDAEKAALGEDEKEDEEQKDDEGDKNKKNDKEEEEDLDDVDYKEAESMTHETFEVSTGRWRNFLYKYGIQVMEKMLEEDEDRLKEKMAEEENEKMAEAKRAYEGFVKKKDMIRIRMPNEPDRVVGGHWKPPRLDFSKNGVVRKKQTAIPLNTVQMMRGSGLRYVHALNKGKNGNEADLERCQKEMLDTGFVHKENFKPDSDSDADDDEVRYKKEKKNNKASKIQRAAEKSRREGCKKSFDLWRTKKELSERATKALYAVDKPSSLEDPDEAVNLWIEVGKALKAIDRNLYKDWVAWTDGFQSGYKCQVLWDFFPPKCCDVHSAAYSGMRDTFLKLLRPGLNYKKVFESQCRKKWNKWEKFCDEKDKDMDEYVKKQMKTDKSLTKDEALDMMELTDRDMKSVMKSLGLKLEGEELRRLMDAFDKNGDGTVSKDEFLSFVNPAATDSRPVTRGDTSAVLEHKCIFETTCCWTGMPNAFVVTKQMTKKGENDPGVKMCKKKDGSYRRIVELPERRKRWDILKSFGLLDDLGVDDLEEMEDVEIPKKCEMAKWDSLNLFEGKKGGEEDEEDDYDDEDDDEYGDEEDRAAKSKRVKYARKALRTLYDFSTDNRAALNLKEMMEKGKPPPAPQLWSAEIGHEEVGDGYDALTDSLLLCWRAKSNSLVAFFQLEMSGPLGSKEQQNNEFKEIFRDPPNSDYEPQYKHWITPNPRLLPNTTYSFRIRAFNGFGPGPYTRMDFTTQPVAPPTPVLVKAGTNVVTIKWKFGTLLNQNFASLKKVFTELAGDASNPMSRMDLLLYLERSMPDLLLFLRSTNLGDGDDVSLYDAIESHNDDNIYYKEVERYQEMVTDDSKSTVSLTRTKYVVEQCSSQSEDTWEHVWRGSAGQAMLKGLEMGETYRYRVFTVNVDGLRGAPSEEIVVNTLVDTPAPLRLSGNRGGVKSNTVKLNWSEEDVTGGVRKSGQGYEKVLAAWTKSEGAGDDNGVSVDMVFSQYDHNKNETIDGADLLALLQDLGVHPSEERIRDAWSELENGGNVSFEDFNRWWKDRKVTYVVKRKEVDGTGKGGDIVSYRGTSIGCEVGGLLPNTKYEFALRVVTPNSYSKFSDGLVVVTAPAATPAPVVVETNDKDVLLKVGYGQGGGSCFLVEKKLIKGMKGGSVNGVAIKKGIEAGWVNVFKGGERLVKCTGLLPNCLYQFRCKASNEKGVSGAYSPVIMVSTRERRVVMRPTNAPEVFVIECTRDAVVGDLILFTERLFTKGGKLVGGPGGGGGGVSMKMSGGVMTPRLSVGSVGSWGSGAGKKTGEEAEFAGERTVAARVLSMRKGGQGGKKKYIRMEVAWSSVSDRKRCADFVLKGGVVVERLEGDIYSFETFRGRWEDEEERA